MRGKKTNISDIEILKYVEEHGQKATADHYGLALTTVHSILERLNYFDLSKQPKLVLSDETVEYIRNNYLNQSARHFHVSLSVLRNFVNKYKLSYQRKRIEPSHVKKSYTDEDKKEICELYRKEHETLNYREIAAKHGISAARVGQIIKYGW